MMSSIDVAQAEKKFRSVSRTQDGIQSLSLWVIHHKTQHEKLVDIWFKVLKKSKIDHRLTLLYVCNDVVQTCRRKHAVVYKDAFKEILRDASLLVRDNSVKTNVKRIYNIWRERGIYEDDYIDDLIDIIDHTKVQPTVSSKLLADFQPLTLMEKVITLNRYENELEHKRRQLVNLRMDASSLEAVRQLKDKKHGKEFCQEFESACSKMDEYVKCVEKEIADRNELIELLEQSELYYDAQYGEAKIVANAYKTFGGKVNALKRELKDKLHSLPESTTPPYSPPDDYDVGHPLSSPDVTPPPVEEITSPIGNCEDPPVETNTKSCGDNVEAVDMDLSDGEIDPADINTLQQNEDSYSPKSDGAPQASPIVDRPASNVSGSVPSIAQGASQSFFGQPEIFAAMRKESPTPEAGGSTPVMDEDQESAEIRKAFLEEEQRQESRRSGQVRKEERKREERKQEDRREEERRYDDRRHDDRRRRDSDDRSSKKSDTAPPKTKTNPIDFLTSLINAKPSSSSSSSTFLQNLGIPKTEPSQSTSSDGSWASWKANEVAAASVTSAYPQPPMPPFGAPPQPPLPLTSAPPVAPYPPLPSSAPYSAPPPAYPPSYTGATASMNGAPYPGPPPPAPVPPNTSPPTAPPGFPPAMQHPFRPPTPATTPIANTQPSYQTPTPNNPAPLSSQPSFHAHTPPSVPSFRPALSMPSSAPYQPRPGQNTSPTNASYPPPQRGPSGDFRPHGQFPVASPPTPPGFPTSGSYPQPPRFPQPGSNNAFLPTRYPGTPNNQNQQPNGSGPPTPVQGPPRPGTPNQGLHPRTPMANQEAPRTPGGYRAPVPNHQEQAFTNMNQGPGSASSQGLPPWSRNFGSQNKTNLTTIQTVDYNSDKNNFSSNPASCVRPPARYQAPRQQHPGGARPLLHEPVPHQGPRPILSGGAHGPPSHRMRVDSERAPVPTSERVRTHYAASGEGQMEFIDKLRRKSNSIGAEAPPLERQNSSSSNLRTLTVVSMDVDNEEGDPDTKTETADAFSIGSFLSNMRKESNENNVINMSQEMESKTPSQHIRRNSEETRVGEVFESSPSRGPWQQTDANPRPPFLRGHNAANDWKPRPPDMGVRPFRLQRPPRFGRPPGFRAGRPQNIYGPREGKHW